MKSFSAKFAFILDLKKHGPLIDSTETIRVLGVVTAVCGLPSDWQTTGRGSKSCSAESNAVGTDLSNSRCKTMPNTRCATPTEEEGIFSVTIDDGTDLLTFWASRRVFELLSTPNLEEGKLYDCTLKLRQGSKEKYWIAENLINIDNPMDEYFRWLELVHHDQSSSQSQSNSFRLSNFCHKFGFPTRKRNCAEVYRLINHNSRLQQEQQQRKRMIATKSSKTMHKRSHPHLSMKKSSRDEEHTGEWQNIYKNTDMNNFKKKGVTTDSTCSMTPRQPSQLDGLLLKDLALVLQKPEQNIQELIEELQLEGKIYQNERGEYLSL